MKLLIVIACTIILAACAYGLFVSDWSGATERSQVDAAARIAIAQAQANAAVDVAAYRAQAQTAQATANAVTLPLVAVVVVGGLLGVVAMTLIAVLLVGLPPAQPKRR